MFTNFAHYCKLPYLALCNKSIIEICTQKMHRVSTQKMYKDAHREYTKDAHRELLHKGRGVASCAAAQLQGSHRVAHEVVDGHRQTQVLVQLLPLMERVHGINLHPERREAAPCRYPPSKGTRSRPPTRRDPGSVWRGTG